MPVSIEMRALELLNARLCHELISPVGAINNGIELLDEEDPEFRKEALKLIGSSAKTAANRLNFYRFAYGSGRGTSGRDAAVSLLEGAKVKLDWQESANALPVDWQRLACNMMALAAEALPRGGTVRVEGTSALGGVTVNAAGDSVNLTAELRAAIGENAAIDSLTARTIHAYYTARVAQTLDTRLVLSEPGPGTVLLGAAKPT